MTMEKYISSSKVEIDIHNMKRDEAKKFLEQFLSKANGNVKEVTVIHGYSSGTVLQQMVRKCTSPYFEVVCAKAILLAADGWRNKEIGERLETPRQIISKWRKRSFEQRLAGLQERPRRGRPDRFFP